MLWQARTADVDCARGLQARFLSNTRVAWGLLAGIAAARLAQEPEPAARPHVALA